jgi:tRNA-splicing ligase RtcB (3'-phosphate/5'-hydroxy nucleic acid ligase)
MRIETGAGVRLWTEGVEVDPSAIKQLANIAALPVIAGHVAVMPDVHLGKGATVGSVIPTRAAIIPAAVGVDIGCGMAAVRTSLSASDLPDSLTALRSRIEQRIPVGFAAHDEPVKLDCASSASAWSRTQRLRNEMDSVLQRFEGLRILARMGSVSLDKVGRQVGTLGGGNHFVEICLDESQRVWLMLHSGSRNIGKTIGQVAIQMAKDVAAKLDRHLPDRDLAWLDEGSEEFELYVDGLLWAQRYAAVNREVMLWNVSEALAQEFGREVVLHETAVNCHHNYAQPEEHFGSTMWLTRKGAVSARAGELGIIPGSMGTRSYIVRGRGHAEAYCSCSHGAGRRLSRNQAKRHYSLEDLERQTAGVECRKDEGVLDEIPGAYKDIDAVMAAQSELVEVVHTLKQVLCIKG